MKDKPSNYDILNGLDQETDLYNSTFDSKTFSELTNPGPTKKGIGSKFKKKTTISRTSPHLPEGDDPEQYNLAVPGNKLKELRETIRKQQHKPTAKQLDQHYELSEEIERRGEAYFKQIDRLNKSNTENRNGNKYKP